MDPLPDSLAAGAHRRRTLLDAGVSAAELRGELWRRPLHGTHALSMSDARSPVQRIAEAASVLPDDGALSGWASAFLQGAADLDGRSWDGSLQPVLMALPPERQVRRRGIRTIRGALAESDLREADGLVVTSPARACFDLMRLSTLEDAVVGIDAMLRAKTAALEDVGEYVAEHAGWKGVPVARTAFALSDGRAASCPESRFRVLWVVEAGLPRPAVNVAVYSPSGLLIGVPDLLDEETGLTGEYDGAFHRELRRHTDDNIREERFESHGLIVVRATALDVMYRRRQTVARLRDAYRRARRRNRHQDRWTLDPP